MLKSLTPKLVCVTCKDMRAVLAAHVFIPGERDRICDGVLICDSCRAWYPVTDYVLELLPPALVYTQSIAAFEERFATELHALACKRLKGTSANSQAFAPQLKQREHFDDYAEGSKPGFVDYPQSPFWRAEAHRFLALWRKVLTKRGAWILDIGCGNGFNSLPLANQNTIIGFDISKGAICKANEDALCRGLAASTTFFVADGTSLPLKDVTFDYVQTIGALHHMPNPAQTVLDILRILIPGGVYYAVENNKTIFRGIFDWMMRLKPLWVEEAGAEPLISHAMMECWISGLPASVTSTTSVFLPPHLFNLVGSTLARWLLEFSDRFCLLVPGLRRQGGQLLVVLRKDR